MQIAIGADGQHQGEGAIEGSYRDYQVRYVSRLEEGGTLEK